MRENQTTGACLFCGQTCMIEKDDLLQAVKNGADAEKAADILATKQCDCDDAVIEREKKARMDAAGEWAKNTFSEQDGALQVALCAIRSTFEGAIDYVTIKIGKHTHKIDTDSDGMIRIRTTYRDSNEETF